MGDRMKCTLQLHSHKILMVVWNCGRVFICALDPITLKQSQHFILLIHCFVSANTTLFPCSISQRPLSFALCLADREDGPTLNGVFIYKQKPTNPSNYSPKRTLKHIPDLISSNCTHLAIISGVSSVSCFVTVVLKELPLEIQYDFTVLTTKEWRHYEWLGGRGDPLYEYVWLLCDNCCCPSSCLVGLYWNA